jgi:3'(2'), 5'-bisphosphate nucleotidase
MVSPSHAQTSGVAPSWPSLDRLVDLARRAGREILAHYASPIAVERKADDSPLTRADRASHAIIVHELECWDPSIPVLSEEGDLPDAARRHEWTRFWLVDPLDGTKEFIKRNGEFTVNLALVDRGVPVMGVVCAPALDLLYAAARGLGAWKSDGGAPLHRIFSRRPEPGAPVRIVESRSHPSAELEAYLATLPVADRLKVGSSIKFCWVAEGRADLYPRFGPTMEWDVAAGDCIFRQSAPEGERGSPLVYNKPDLRNPAFVLGFVPMRPGVVWLTGLSGSGKSTIAERVCALLAERGVAYEYLDGDAIRAVFPSTGFSREERDAHVRRVGYLASCLERHGVVVVASFVSPYRASRDFVRRLCRRFVEIYVATPIEECERRDPKGLYRRARTGEIANFTGVSDPYEPPEQPDLVLETTATGVEEAARAVLATLAPFPSRPWP